MGPVGMMLESHPLHLTSGYWAEFSQMADSYFPMVLKRSGTGWPLYRGFLCTVRIPESQVHRPLQPSEQGQAVIMQLC